MSFFSDVDDFLLSFGSTHPATENSNKRFLYNDINDRSRFCWKTPLAPSLSFVSSAYCSRNRAIFRAMLKDAWNVANTRGRRPIRKRDLSSSRHMSWRLYSQFPEQSSITFSNIEYHRDRIAFSISGDMFLIVESPAIDLWLRCHASKRFSALSSSTEPSYCCNNT